MGRVGEPGLLGWRRGRVGDPALLGPGVLGPRGGEAGFHGVLTDVGDGLFPFVFVANPAVEPFALPERAACLRRGADLQAGATFEALHDFVERLGAIRRRSEPRVPMIRHNRIVRHRDGPIAQRGEFPGENGRSERLAQQTGPVPASRYFSIVAKYWRGSAAN